MHPIRWRWIATAGLVAALSLGLLAAACGDDEDDGNGNGVETPAATEPAETPMAGMTMEHPTAEGTVEVPEDATMVEVALTEFQFIFDAEDITDGNVVFEADNIGGEEHELALFSIPEDLDLESAVMEEETPEGVTDIVHGGPFAPGQGGTVVAPELPLAPGRYAMVCFVETTDGTPHAELGMFADFTIE